MAKQSFEVTKSKNLVMDIFSSKGKHIFKLVATDDSITITGVGELQDIMVEVESRNTVKIAKDNITI